MRHGWCAFLLFLMLVLASGCGATNRAGPPSWREIRKYAAPLLTLAPDANWTECCNRLLDFGPESLEYLATRPEMCKRAAPDDLSVMLHTSLLRLLANSRHAPQLSVRCFETTLNVIHLAPKVRGDSLGSVIMTDPQPPRAWHCLYPADFAHDLAARIDVEGDRRAMRAWWKQGRSRPALLMRAQHWHPRPDNLWPLLERRLADRWQFTPARRAVLCAQPPTETAWLRVETYEYNLVRAAGIWLGSSPDEKVLHRLIDLLDHPSPVLVHNALFALRHSVDDRIRAAIEQFENSLQHSPPDSLRVCVPAPRKRIGVG